ncbi:MAG: hypothetical protein FWE09_00015 [Treponema sp.]|nr:hypothetical protein [Treponema sp.]
MGDFWTEKQKKDIAFFNENLDSWAENSLYRRKYVVISGMELKALHDTFEAALEAAAPAYGNGNYIIQQILPEDDTVNFLSPALALA